ncbi:hypothetical protein LPJ73_002699, partial [Coemansia sp. RSA 2703]
MSAPSERKLTADELIANSPVVAKVQDEKMDTPAAVSRPPPAAGRRMRSASNIAVVETPSAAQSDKNERPIQRAIRETYEEEKEAEKEGSAELSKKNDEVMVEPAATGTTDSHVDPMTATSAADTNEATEKVADAVVHENSDAVAKPNAIDKIDEEDSSMVVDEHTEPLAAHDDDTRESVEIDVKAEQTADKTIVDKSDEKKNDDATTVTTLENDNVVVEPKIQSTSTKESDTADSDAPMAVDKVKSAEIDENEELRNSDTTNKNLVDEMDVVVEDEAKDESDAVVKLVTEVDANVSDVVGADTTVKGDDASDLDNSLNTDIQQESAQKEQDNEESPTNDDDISGDKPASINKDKKQDENDESEHEEKEQADEESDAAEEVEKPRVQIYGSTVSGNRTYKKQARDLFAMLEANEIDFEFICLAVDENAKKYVRRKALGNMTIPQVYVDGEFKG